jgi:hypothetical protein
MKNKKEEIRKNKIWKIECLKRDKFRCQICNKKVDFVTSDIHHIIRRVYKKTKYMVDNGLTLCRTCHWKIHNTIGFEDWFLESVVGKDKYEFLKKEAGKIW